MPLPLHARSVLDELPRIEGPEQLARRLKPLLGKTASVSRARRLGLLAASIAPLFFFAGIFFVGMSMGQRWLDRTARRSPVVPLSEQMEKLERTSGAADDAQEQRRRALEVYIAGRFGETISDPAVWSSPFATNLFSKNQRKIAERAVTDHPDPSAKEVADAAARLQPFLDEMPDGLPGLE